MTMLFHRISKISLSVMAVWLMSCINTSYSRLDEVEITGNELDLILGQFAHHGERFYENEVVRTKEVLAENENDFVARNDLASAYIKLKQYEKAEAEFNENEKRHPGEYETAANRGVLYKKMGKYKLAAEYIALSLETKKEGHMGLGDYYLRMTQWLDAVEKEEYYFKSFLGMEYLDNPGTVRVGILPKKEYLLTLIKNDYTFSDVYLVLGDVYFQEGKYQLAIRCYHRAKGLDHPLKYIIINERLNEVAKALKSGKKSDQIVEAPIMATHERQVEQEIKAAREWLTKYQELEATLIEEGKPVDFKSMKKELIARGISKPKVKEAMIYKGKIVDENKGALNSYYIDGGFLSKLVIAAIISVLLMMFFRLVWKKRK